MDFMKGGKMVKKSGFTLAEVLVTLTIIGTVAAMTVPSLMNSTATQENTAAYKKMISTLNQAITMQYALEGSDMRDFVNFHGDGAMNDANNLGLGQMLQNRLQVVRTLDARDASQGHPEQENNAAGNTALVLADGTIVEIPAAVQRTSSCAASQAAAGFAPDDDGQPGDFAAANNDTCLYSIIVDVNGNKGTCTMNDSNALEALKPEAIPDRLTVKDCFWLDVYPTEVRPGDWTGRMIMYNNSRPVDDIEEGGQGGQGDQGGQGGN